MSLLRIPDSAIIKGRMGFFSLSTLSCLKERVNLTNGCLGSGDHALLTGPDFTNKKPAIQNALLSMHNNPISSDILKRLEFEKWEIMDDEETEFLIDLVDTLSPDKK